MTGITINRQLKLQQHHAVATFAWMLSPFTAHNKGHPANGPLVATESQLLKVHDRAEETPENRQVPNCTFLLQPGAHATLASPAEQVWITAPVVVTAPAGML